MKKNNSLGQALRLCSGQAAILIVFVIGMVSLLIGMSLSKTGFQESMMGRSAAGSTKAFYAANSGIEDAFIVMKTLREEDLPDEYSFNVDEGTANVRIKTISAPDEDDVVKVTEREIVSVGKYGNFIRKIRARVQNTVIAPEFTRFIQAGDGGIEIGHNVVITSMDENPVNIYSKSFVRGRDYGSDTSGTCSSPTSTTYIDGNIFAYGVIEKLDNGSGPCIAGNAYAGELKDCRIYGDYYSDNEEIGCILEETSALCDPEADPENCKRPDERDLPDIGAGFIWDYLEDNDAEVITGDCEIGGANDCSSPSTDGTGTPTIGNIIINGNLETRSNSALYLSGPVWVTGDVTLESNQTISLDPANPSESSLIILAEGKIIADANTRFTSEDNKFLLMASLYPEGGYADPEAICDDGKDYAVTINPNVQSILFYAVNGCAYVAPTASEAFLGAILAQGVVIDNNVNMIYDPALQNAEFFLSEEGGWQILSFTEI